LAVSQRRTPTTQELPNNGNGKQSTHLSWREIFFAFPAAYRALHRLTKRDGCACWPGQVWRALKMLCRTMCGLRRLYDTGSSREFRQPLHLRPLPCRPFAKSTGQRLITALPAAALAPRRFARCGQKGCMR
jgi:hypothetical protein